MGVTGIGSGHGVEGITSSSETTITSAGGAPAPAPEAPVVRGGRPTSGAFAAVAAAPPASDAPAISWSSGVEPLSSILVRNDHAALDRAMDDLVLGRAPAARLVEVEGLLAVAARGNTPAKRLLYTLGERAGLDLGRVISTLQERPAFRRLVEAGDLESADVEAYARSGAEVDALRRALAGEDLRAAVSGRPQAMDRLLAATPRDAFARLLTATIAGSADLRKFVEGDAGRRAAADAIALRARPVDPSIAENRDVNVRVDAFRDWDRYPYAMIVVPGHTAVDATPAPGVDGDTRKRLEQAKRDLDSGKAPFLLLSGGNVHPEGTPFHEALEMKKELVKMGVPADRIVVDAGARHTTTNLRNAGRYMIAHGLGDRRALVTTTPLQDFYLSNPGISTFHARSRKELGYKVGDLSDAPGLGMDTMHAVFRPSRDVVRTDWRDPLDP